MNSDSYISLNEKKGLEKYTEFIDYKIRSDTTVYFRSLTHSYMVIKYKNTLQILIKYKYLIIKLIA